MILNYNLTSEYDRDDNPADKEMEVASVEEIKAALASTRAELKVAKGRKQREAVVSIKNLEKALREIETLKVVHNTSLHVGM